MGAVWKQLGFLAIWRKVHWLPPQSNLIHPSLSTLLDMAKASADRVDRTTRAIFLEDQVSGLIGADSLLFNWLLVAHINVPWNESNCLGLANDASPKLTWVSSSSGILRKPILTSDSFWASLKTLLASSKVDTVALAIWVCTSPNFAAMSGRVWVTAYWRLPMIPLSLDNSWSVMGLSGCCLRDRPISIPGICRM